MFAVFTLINTMAGRQTKYGNDSLHTQYIPYQLVKVQESNCSGTNLNLKSTKINVKRSKKD